MSVLLVRHADAQSRHGWPGDDRLRPLTPKGRAQAEGLVDLLAEHRIATIVSSPAVRCVATVQPLAADRGLGIVTDEGLWEGASTTALRRRLDELDHAVLCSHGDLIPDVLDVLIGEGIEAVGRDCKKGSTWVLERDGARFARATYLRPPSVTGD